MQVLVRLPCGAAKCFEVEELEDITCLREKLAKYSGVPSDELCLWNGTSLVSDNAVFALSNAPYHLHVTHRLRGGAGSLTVRVKPRIQKDKWSLYWKESMETKTEPLEEVRLEVKQNATVGEMHQALQEKFQWLAPDKCERLEGFKDPWDTAHFKGRQLQPSTALDSLNLADSDSIVTVRRVLVPEVWKVIEDGQDEDEISSEEEDW